MPRSTLLFLALCFLPGPLASQEKSLKKQLEAIAQVSDSRKRIQATEILTPDSVRTREDVLALHLEIGRLRRSYRDSTDRSEVFARASTLAQLLGESRRVELHDGVVDALAQEIETIPDGFAGPYSEKDPLVASERALQLEVIEALVRSAQDGGNQKALPLLRRLRKKGGLPGKMAEDAIGTLGGENDLIELINEIKADPSLDIGLHNFGNRAIARLLDEIKAPGLSDRQRLALFGCIPAHVERRWIKQILPYINDPNPYFAAYAAKIVATSASREDVAAIRDLAQSSHSRIRGHALTAIERVGLDSFEPEIERFLGSDPLAINRKQAARIVIAHGSEKWGPILERVAREDRSQEVREAVKREMAGRKRGHEPKR